MLNIKRILYPTDFSRCANQAFYRALYLAKKYQAELHLLHVIVLHDDDRCKVLNDQDPDDDL